MKYICNNSTGTNQAEHNTFYQLNSTDDLLSQFYYYTIQVPRKIVKEPYNQ